MSASQVPSVTYAGVRVVLFSSRSKTLGKIDDIDPLRIERMYREISGYMGPIKDVGPCYRGVQSRVQLDWWAVHEPKADVEQREAKHAERLLRLSAECAQSQSSVESKIGPRPKGPSKRPNGTVKDYIVSCLRSGLSDDDITEGLKSKFADTAAARRPKVHIGFYRSKLKNHASDFAPKRKS